MRGWIWIGLLFATPSLAQDTMTFESVDIEGDRKKAAWTELGARPAWVMPTPICLPKNFAHHRVRSLPTSVKLELESVPSKKTGGSNGR